MKFAYTLPNGQVAIVVAAPMAHLNRGLERELTDAEYLAHVLGRTFPDGHPADLIRLADDWIAPDRAQRSGWRIEGGTVVI